MVVVSYGDEFESGVVADVEEGSEVLLQLLQEYLVVVDAEGEAEGGELHEVYSYVECGECGEDGLEVVFGNEGEVLGLDGDE